MIGQLFRRGRHHVRTAPRLADGGLVTVSTVAARVRREAREASLGSVAIEIRADVEGMSSKLRAALDQHRAAQAVDRRGAIA